MVAVFVKAPYEPEDKVDVPPGREIGKKRGVFAVNKYMSWGKANRMNCIFAKDGRTVMLAFDHGYFLGPISGMGRPPGGHPSAGTPTLTP